MLLLQTLLQLLGEMSVLVAPILSTGLRHFLANLWPWCFVAGVIAWLLVLPGTLLLDSFFGVSNPDFVVPVLTFSAFGFLVLTVFAGFGHDVQRHSLRPVVPATRPC